MQRQQQQQHRSKWRVCQCQAGSRGPCCELTKETQFAFFPARLPSSFTCGHISVDDGTGVIHCTCWFNNNSVGSSALTPSHTSFFRQAPRAAGGFASSPFNILAIGNVVRVRGQVKLYLQQRQITAESVCQSQQWAHGSRDAAGLHKAGGQCIDVRCDAFVLHRFVVACIFFLAPSSVLQSWRRIPMLRRCTGWNACSSRRASTRSRGESVDGRGTNKKCAQPLCLAVVFVCCSLTLLSLPRCVCRRAQPSDPRIRCTGPGGATGRDVSELAPRIASLPVHRGAAVAAGRAARSREPVARHQPLVVVSISVTATCCGLG